MAGAPSAAEDESPRDWHRLVPCIVWAAAHEYEPVEGRCPPSQVRGVPAPGEEFPVLDLGPNVRERPCVECGKMVVSMPRGPAKTIHEACKQARRKFYELRRAERNEKEKSEKEA